MRFLEVDLGPVWGTSRVQIQVQIQGQIQCQILRLDPRFSDLRYIRYFLVKRPYEPINLSISQISLNLAGWLGTRYYPPWYPPGCTTPGTPTLVLLSDTGYARAGRWTK